MARILAERMRVTLGEPVLVENVTGAGGSIGVGRAVQSPPDGYTISLRPSRHACRQRRRLQARTTTWSPISSRWCCCRAIPMIVVSKNAVPATSLKELIDMAEVAAGACRPPAPPARAPAATSPASISRTSPASSCNTCRIAARARDERPRRRPDRHHRSTRPPTRSTRCAPATSAPMPSPTTSGLRIRAGHSDRRRGRAAGLSHDAVVRPVGAQGHAAGDHRKAERCGGRGAERSRREEADRRISGSS